MGGIPEVRSKEQEWMRKELRRLFFTLKPWLTPQPELFESYTVALGDVSAPEMTSLVNQAVKTQWPDLNWCSPNELSKLLREMRSATKAENTPPPREDCKKCRGSGFEIVMINGERKAKTCDCQKSPDPHHSCRSLRLDQEAITKREKEKAARGGR